MSARKPRREYGTGTIYQTKSGTWLAKLPSDASGGQRRVGTFDTYEEADAALAKALKTGERRVVTPKAYNGPMTTMTRTITQFLQEFSEGRVRSGPVALGRLPGLPSSTSNPDDVERAVKELVRRRDTESMSVTHKLVLRQRIITLKEELQRLRTEPDDDLQAYFIAYGAEWAAAKGISRGALIEEYGKGIKPILNEAGIV